MPDGGDSMVLYGEGEAWEVTGASGAEIGAGEAVTEAGGAVLKAVGAAAVTLNKDVPLAVTAVLAWPVLEPPL